MSNQTKAIRENLDRSLKLLNQQIGYSDDRGSYLSDTRRHVLDAIGSLESYNASCLIAEASISYEQTRRDDAEQQARLDAKPTPF